MPRSRPQPGWRRSAWAGSAVLHLTVLAVLLFFQEMIPPPKPDELPSFAIEFEPSTTQTNGGPNPSVATETPNGVKSPQMQPTPPPAAASQPQVNLMPPEYTQPEQTQVQPDTEALPPPMQRPRYGTQLNPKADKNPFAHPMEFSLAPRQPRSLSAGLPGSRSLDLSAGPVVRGGRLTDAVAHVVGPGGAADYMELLSEFIETHKYYPPSALADNEEGTAAISITIERDGTVRSLRLVSSSGSRILDSAWMAIFRDNKLPAFTDDMPWPQQTFELSLDYQIIYHNDPGQFRDRFR
jgi:protein TonB